MSLRNLRKVVGPTTLPPPDGSSDEEYEPLYAKYPNKSQYDGVSGQCFVDIWLALILYYYRKCIFINNTNASTNNF